MPKQPKSNSRNTKLKKTLVVYKTYLGSSGKYAKWIAEKSSANMLEFNRAKNNHLSEYRNVVVVSGTYAGQMPLVRFLKKHWKVLKDKNVVAVSVGAAPTDDPWSKRSYDKIPEEIRNKIKYYKLPSSVEKKGREAIKKSSISPVADYLKKIN